MKKFIISVLIVVVAAGCTTAPRKTAQELAVDHGALVSSFRTDQIRSIEVMSSKGKRHVLHGFSLSAGERSFFDWLPQGTYQITKLVTAGIVNSSVITFKKGILPSFEVTIGKLTDLNQIYPIHLGDDQYTLVSQKKSEPFVPSMLMNNPNLVDLNNVNSWEIDGALVKGKMSTASSGQGLLIDMIIAYGESSQRGEELNFDGLTHENAMSIFKRYGQPSSEFVVDENGIGYFGTLFGQVRYVSDNSWKLLDTGIDAPVVALSPQSPENILVAMANGKILERSPSSEGWSVVATYQAGGDIVDVRRFAGELIVTVKPRSDLGIVSHVEMYRYQGGRFTLISKLDAGRAPSNLHHTFIRVIPIGEELLVFLSYTKNIYRVKVDSGEVKQIELPSPMVDATYNPDVGLLSVWLAKGLFSKAYVTDDLGGRWIGLPKPPYVPLHIHLNSLDQGYMWSVAIGINSSAFKLDALNADKKSWNKESKSEKDCKKILANFKLNQHHCLLPNGAIRSYSNGVWAE